MNPTPAWRTLAAAYNTHHVNCPACIAAGRGDQYGQRCTPGLKLWQAYGATLPPPAPPRAQPPRRW